MKMGLGKFLGNYLQHFPKYTIRILGQLRLGLTKSPVILPYLLVNPVIQAEYGETWKS